MVQQRIGTWKIVSISLNRDPKPEVGGEIVFGGADCRHFGGDYTFVPIARRVKVAIGSAQVCLPEGPRLVRHMRYWELKMANGPVLSFCS